MQSCELSVTGMSCSACSARVEKVVRGLQGVGRADVNLLKNSLKLEYDESQLSLGEVAEAVSAAGYGLVLPETGKGRAKTASAAPTGTSTEPTLADERRTLLWAFGFLAVLCWFSMGSMVGLPLPDWVEGPRMAPNMALVQFLLLLPILYLRRITFIRGFKSLWHRAPNMDALVAVGAGASVLYGIYALFALNMAQARGDEHALMHFAHSLYFEGAGMILTLIALGKYFEARAKKETSVAIEALMRLAPATATVLRDGVEVTVSRDELVVGDLVVVKTGETIPVDGVLIEGAGSVNESMITGESIPVAKRVDDTLTGATLLEAGHLTMRVTRVGDETVLAQIIRLVDEATSSKPPVSRLADRVSGVFVPIVMGIALVTALVWLALGYDLEFALSCAIAVLVISCPCALGLATPTAVMVGTGVGAKTGLLFKSAEALEKLAAIETVVMDKTGTLTEGKPRVLRVVPSIPKMETIVLMVAGALESRSEHPLARAVMAEVAAKGIPVSKPEEFTQYPGEGISGMVMGSLCAAGNAELMERLGLSIPAPLTAALADVKSAGATPLFIASKDQVIGLIAVRDELKADSKRAVAQLKALGVRVVMLTGDNRETALAMAREAGIEAENVIAGVKPATKADEVARLKASGAVAMVGDGVNDAPALALADVGLAIGAGTEVAQASADVVLMRNAMVSVPAAIRLSRATMRNIRQNLFWAFIYNTIGIPVAAGVFYPAFGLTLSPMIAAAAMSLSSVSVVSNTLRLRFFKPSEGPGDEMHPEATSLTPDEKESPKMEKVIHIEGMHCGHCVKSVTEALKMLPGVDNVVVSLEKKTADVTVAESLTDDMLKAVVAGAGFKATDVVTK